MYRHLQTRKAISIAELYDPDSEDVPLRVFQFGDYYYSPPRYSLDVQLLAISFRDMSFLGHELTFYGLHSCCASFELILVAPTALL